MRCFHDFDVAVGRYQTEINRALREHMREHRCCGEYYLDDAVAARVYAQGEEGSVRDPFLLAEIERSRK